MDGVACGTLRAGVWPQRPKLGVHFVERVPALPEQSRLEALLAQILKLVEVDFEHALVSAKLAPQRAEVVEPACHQGREPDTGLVLRLVELHRQIDIADLERTPRIGAEDPDLAHPRQIATLALDHASEQTFDPLRRLRALHRTQASARSKRPAPRLREPPASAS